MKLQIGDTVSVVQEFPIGNRRARLGDLYDVKYIGRTSTDLVCRRTREVLGFLDYELPIYFKEYKLHKWSSSMAGAFGYMFDDSYLKDLNLKVAPKKCTCGSASLGHPGHSKWCDIH